MVADQQARAEVRQDDEAEHDIERLDDGVARHERGRDDEQQRDQIESEQRVAELMRPVRAALVELADRYLGASERRRGDHGHFHPTQYRRATWHRSCVCYLERTLRRAGRHGSTFHSSPRCPVASKLMQRAGRVEIALRAARR